MHRQVIYHIKDVEYDREVIERLVETNLEGKLGRYLKKFNKEDSEVRIELFISLHSHEENAHRQFNGKLEVKADGKYYRYAREMYHNLDDLINHLFTHLKESLSSE